MEDTKFKQLLFYRFPETLYFSSVILGLNNKNTTELIFLLEEIKNENTDISPRSLQNLLKDKIEQHYTNFDVLYYKSKVEFENIQHTQFNQLYDYIKLIF